ncbi:hypothetical protein M406DRAFT_354295 [Cryphonectria parasitica EP155]|uniref:Hypersensitive response-inducing protein n=1 Tax=Cryphonectria parasitica (strain ATCC 38755 / EP155) TaxID=660469 RepID=A0A9P4YB84_CRYP1|nr:uncharacterized protein M406DRAFT_354295 [Cryphonectria parasitica EP155]KAF3770143.1 hypothetical protein M406DRAFT_354295 [Cryphonectria parasitica EP155]
MQFSTAIVVLASAMSASAETLFSVSDFTAACIPHSSQCSYNFKVLQPGTGETTGVTCSAQKTSDGTLPAVTDGTCTDSARTWTISKPAAGGLTLTVSQQVSAASSQSGSYTIPASDLTTSQTGASVQQSYTGPTAFDLSD